MVTLVERQTRFHAILGFFAPQEKSGSRCWTLRSVQLSRVLEVDRLACSSAIAAGFQQHPKALAFRAPLPGLVNAK